MTNTATPARHRRPVKARTRGNRVLYEPRHKAEVSPTWEIEELEQDSGACSHADAGNREDAG